MNEGLIYDVIHDLGITEDEYYEIGRHFSCRLDVYEWLTLEVVDDLVKHTELVEHEDDNYLELSTGKIIYIPNEILRKDLMSQID